MFPSFSVGLARTVVIRPKGLVIVVEEFCNCSADTSWIDIESSCFSINQTFAEPLRIEVPSKLNRFSGSASQLALAAPAAQRSSLRQY
jgi:hypothetical protein